MHKIKFNLIITVFSLTFNIVFGNYEIETSTIEEDRIEAKSRPEIASQIAYKWYDHGKKEIGLEFDNLAIASEIADVWYYQRKEKEIALEFDKLAIENNPELAVDIAFKWINRGENEIAFRFLPPYDMETSTLDRDRLESWKYPNLKDKIADKWYERGNKTDAIIFDSLYLDFYPEMLDKIVNKWNARGETNIALSYLNDIHIVMKKFEDLINESNFAEAEEYANKMLEYWTTQSDEEIEEFLDKKIIFAAKIGSDYYFNTLKSKLISLTGYDKYDEYHYCSKFLKNIGLEYKKNNVSIVDYLVSHSYIDPTFLDRFNISQDEAHKMFAIILYELAKKSDITFSILHFIALYAKTDPYFRFDIFFESPRDIRGIGAYSHNFKKAYLCEFPLMSKPNLSTLMHEWTHQLLYVLFNNQSLPYLEGDEKAQIAFDEAVTTIWNKFDQVPEFLKYKNIFNSITNYELALVTFQKLKSGYAPDEYATEMFSHFVELFANDAIEDPKVKEFVQPLYDYWMQYINPAIEGFIKKNAKLENFVSTWEREYILDPFYRQQVEKEFENDLKTIQSETSKASSLSDKWYFRGKIDNAVEIDKIAIKHEIDQSKGFMDEGKCTTTNGEY